MALAILVLLFSGQTGGLSNRVSHTIDASASAAAARFSESAEYPRTLAFRTLVEVPARRGTPMEQVLDSVSRYDMIIAKALDEELLTGLETAPYLQAIKARARPLLAAGA